MTTGKRLSDAVSVDEELSAPDPDDAPPGYEPADAGRLAAISARIGQRRAELFERLS